MQQKWVVGCTRLTLIAWLSSKLDGRSHFLLRCSPKPKKYLWRVSNNQGYSLENSPAIFIRGGEPWLMGYCWRISFKVLEVLYLAAVLPSSFACQKGMWDTHIAALWGSPTVPGRHSATKRR